MDTHTLSAEARRVLAFFHRIPERSVNGNIPGNLDPYSELVATGYIEETPWPNGDRIPGWRHFRLIDKRSLR